MHSERNTIKTFLVFLGFTTLLWFVMKFSKNYSEEITASVTFTNIPNDRFLNKQTDSLLRLTLTGNGFKLMNYKLFMPEIRIDANKTMQLQKQHYYFQTETNLGFLKKQLDYNGSIISMHTDTLHVYYDASTSKRIPVKLNADITYASGYSSATGLVIKPDSVTINGPDKLISQISFMDSKPVVLSNINKREELRIALQFDNPTGELQVAPKYITGVIEPVKYTEGAVKVPIKLKNIPKGIRVKIFPKEVHLTYSVSLTDYASIKATNFSVHASFNEAFNNFLPLHIEKMPAAIRNARLQEQKVQYLILK